MSNTTPGLPSISDRPLIYPSPARWFRAGFDRFPASTITALLISWTAAVIAMWGAALGAAVALFTFVLAVVFHVPVFGNTVNVPFLGSVFPQSGWPTTILGALAAVAVGAAAGFLFVYAGSILTAPTQVIAGLIIGALIAAAIVLTYGSIEQTILNLRGFRRPSRDEARRLAPLVENAADALGLGSIPTIAISDDLIPRAAVYTKTICLTRSLIDTLDESELRAVIAHELAHWKNADVIGKVYVQAAGWPVIFLYEFGVWMVNQGAVLVPGNLDSRVAGVIGVSFRGLLPLLGHLIAFPAFLLVNFVLIPVMAAETRRSEYEADAAVKAGGLGSPLAAALRKLALFEPGSTGWERRLAATHPPTELRIEALQPAKPGDEIYQQPELGALNVGTVMDVLLILGLLGGLILVVVVGWALVAHILGVH